MRAPLDRVDLLELDARRKRAALLRRQHAERVGPQLLDRRPELRRLRETLAPQLRVHAVVGLLTVDLRREPCDARVVVLHQRRDAKLVRLLVQPAPRDRVRPVEQVELDERRAAVLLERPIEGQRVGVVCQQLVHRPRMSDLVLRDRRERDVLLEQRRDPRPLRVAPADHELVVSQTQ